ncbi:hypothetical protein DPMN_182066 [Dreissena polymorpha]|uniref:Uncharacterized protein n=1 Tax=Dreissena polymorpha TaxID=45954 RepID=A0A9D4I504_DREPO|nr:hypothetical protein DPMN_182066 [Dreissena polymorpha]
MCFQIKWRLEISEALEKIHSEGSHLAQNEEELVKRRLQELRYILRLFHLLAPCSQNRLAPITQVCLKIISRSGSIHRIDWPPRTQVCLKLRSFHILAPFTE